MLNPCYSPVSILASLLSQTEHTPHLKLITGESGAGKTTWCENLVHQSRFMGLSPHGLVSPGVYQSGVKIGIDLVAVQSGERRRLANRKQDQRKLPFLSRKTETLGWHFDPDVISWAEQVLNDLPGGEILILDELGPLEFSRNGGLQSGLTLIDSCRYTHTFVVIRPVLLEDAKARWPWGTILNVSGIAPEKGKVAQ